MSAHLLSEFDGPDCLIYGIGNIGRQDDGLGWAFVDWLESHGQCTRADRVRTYQLQLEDADLLSRYRRVLFVDSTKDVLVDSFALQRPEPRFDISFTSHALSVPAVLATCHQCFGHLPDTLVLAVRGYEWELRVGLTAAAAANLAAATDYLGAATNAAIREPA